ncbi:MAG: adenine phosphoribosyltransferase [Clostridiales bacterium]|nr:adenine phosphoribosyltransferase [Clostridiales bacterium]
MDLSNMVRVVHDFPREGIVFRDITTVLRDKDALAASIDQMAQKLCGLDFDLIVGPESRGFIFGVPVAYKLRKGFVPVRKKGKLPFHTVSKTYDLEYGAAVIEMHRDAVQPGQRVVIVDDLLATGGTARAVVDMLEEAGARVISLVFLIELSELNGRKLFDGFNVDSIITY